MECRRKIDDSLRERHGILRLLERLKCDTLSLTELDEIGGKLQKAGKRALSPLVRRLWREENGDLVARYAYLLDFFDDNSWLDQLIQITLRRKDLELEGKAALLGLLDGCGVDVSLPPFASLLEGLGGALSGSLPRLLDLGEEGLICCVEDILFCPMEQRLAIISHMPAVDHPLVVDLLEVLTRIDDEEIVSSAVNALGRIRSVRAANVLHRLGKMESMRQKDLVTRSLRRLSFLGIDTTSASPIVSLPPLYAAYASPFDGAGNRSLCVARKQGGNILVLYLHIHETKGINAAWGENSLSGADFEQRLNTMIDEEGIVEVPLDYVMLLVNDALYHNQLSCNFMPAEYYVRCAILDTERLYPNEYRLEIPDTFLEAISPKAQQLSVSATLLDHDYFAGWFLATAKIYELAEEWACFEKTLSGQALTHAIEDILIKCCQEVIYPELQNLRNRLLRTAELMRKTAQPLFWLERTYATFFSLSLPQQQLHRHPFIQRLALESMEVAREALAEGYDLRQQDDDEVCD